MELENEKILKVLMNSAKIFSESQSAEDIFLFKKEMRINDDTADGELIIAAKYRIEDEDKAPIFTAAFIFHPKTKEKSDVLGQDSFGIEISYAADDAEFENDNTVLEQFLDKYNLRNDILTELNVTMLSEHM